MRKFIALLAGVILAIALLAGVILATGATSAIAPVHPPVMQLVSFSDCPFGQGCIYVDVNGGGAVQHVIFSQVGNRCQNMNSTLNNKMSSSIETIGSGWHFEFWDFPNCGTGGTFSPFIQPDDTSADWSAGVGVHNDLASSYKLIQG